MGLIAWYPLNGNLKNYGLGSYDIVNKSVTYVDGKLGKALSLSGGQYIQTNSPLFHQGAYSISVWIKTNISGTQTIACCRQAVGLGFSIFIWNGGELRIDSVIDEATDQWNTGYKFTANEWTHLIITSDKYGRTIFYINGEKKGQKIVSRSQLANVVGTVTSFGASQTNGTGFGNYFNGCLNDIKIYDHELTKAEVKEISKGCLLHYSFNNGYGNENLIIEANKASSWVSDGCAKSNIQDKEFGECIKVVGSSANCRIYRNVQNVWTPVGAKFTVSFWAKSDEDGTIINASRSIADFSSNFTLTTKWQRYVGHITTTASVTNGTLSIRIIAANKTIYIADVKLENGEYDSPWSPNPSDELYSQLGFDDTIICNNAGYKMDGIMSKQLTYSSDSIIGTSSLDLKGEDYISYIRVPDYPKLEKDFTWNVWVKQNNSTLPKITQTVISQGRDWVNNNAENGTDCGFNIFIVNGKPEIRYGHWVASGSSNRQLLSNVTLDNEWHMITASIDKDGISRIYVDGTLKNTSTVATICKYTQATGNLIIGKTSYRYADTNQFFPFNGLIDDVKLFTTTLSDNDIKQLYESKARIDRNGNVYCGEFIEDNIREELLASQKLGLSQATGGEAAIFYEENGTQVINKITFSDTFTSWKYIWNNNFDSSKILGRQLILKFKYRVDVNDAIISSSVLFCRGDSTGGQPISKNEIILTENWQEYVGIITMGDTFNYQEIYIRPYTNIKNHTMYIKDLSLKVYDETDKDIYKSSIIFTNEYDEMEESTISNLSKYGTFVTNQIIEI